MSNILQKLASSLNHAAMGDLYEQVRMELSANNHAIFAAIGPILINHCEGLKRF